ncbi:MAG: MarR family transcriptional regulator [Sphingomonadales bacterium]|nr:MarR family transcriptional regulator [Sphingomonadales bacterium]MDE2172178.1 MarR family transcriptional regulator [Sphingomonadales bacterium]
MAAKKGRGEAAEQAEDKQWTRGLDDVIGYHLRRAQEASFAAYARSVGEIHIWPGWYALLRIIHDNPGINQTELSAASGRDKSTLTASLRELGKAGLVERERDEVDRRNFRLKLSAGGAAQLADLEVKAAAHNARIDAIVGPDHRDLFLSILKELSGKL